MQWWGWVIVAVIQRKRRRGGVIGLGGPSRGDRR